MIAVEGRMLRQGVQPEHNDEGVSSRIKELNWPYPVQVVGRKQKEIARNMNL
jgi:hypothetical protein